MPLFDRETHLTDGDRAILARAVNKVIKSICNRDISPTQRTILSYQIPREIEFMVALATVWAEHHETSRLKKGNKGKASNTR